MSEPLRVALISTQRGWGGGEEQAWQLALGLRRHGHDCQLFARRGGRLSARAGAAGIPCLTLNSRYPWPWTVRSMLRQLRDASVRIVHLNDAHAVSLAGRAAGRLPGVLRVAARRTSFPLRAPHRYRRAADYLFCVSRRAAELACQAGFPADRTVVIPDGVDPRRVEAGCRATGRKVLNMSPDERLLLSVGSLVACKGHRHLIAAMPRILAHHPTTRLVIAGEGPEEVPLKRQIEATGISAHVRLLGFRHDVPDLMRACDLFVFPSLEEGLGSTLIDAMLAGRPIVTTPVGGVPDLVAPPESDGRPWAWLAPPGDARQLADRILDAWAQPQQTRSMVERGRQFALDRLTVDRMIASTVEAYRQGLARRA